MAGTDFTAGAQAINRRPILGRADVRIAPLSDEGWVAVWQTSRSDGTGSELRQQRFNRLGAPIGREAPVGGPETRWQRTPALAALPDGGWIVVWQGEAPDETRGIFGRRFDAGGQPRDAGSVIAPLAPGLRTAPELAPVHPAGFVVCWASEVEDGSSLRIVQRPLDGAGLPLRSGEVVVNRTTAGWQGDVGIAALPDGGWVVVWEGFEGENSQPGIYQQRFDAQGAPTTGAEVAVNPDPQAWQFGPFVTALSNGGWVVGWQALDEDNVNLSLFQRCFTLQGVARPSADGRVNTAPLGWRFKPAVTPLPDGGWETTWITESRNGSAWGVYLRRYDAHGVPQRLLGHLAQAAPQVEQLPTLTRLTGQGLVLTWTSRDEHAEIFHIRQRRYRLSALHEGPQDSTIATSSLGWQGAPLVVPLPAGRCLVVWAEKTPDGRGCNLYQQMLDAQGSPMLSGQTSGALGGEGGPPLSAAAS